MSSEVRIIGRNAKISDLENYITGDYDFEIFLYRWQKILIFILNIFTGGLGTLLLPFINHKKNVH